MKTICEALGLARSTFWRYYHKGNISPTRRLAPCRLKIKEKVRALALKYPTYGYRRIWGHLRREGIFISKKTVEATMKDLGLLQPIKRCLAKRKAKGIVIRPVRSNQVWQSDLTKVWTGRDGWSYLFAVLDVYDRRTIWADLFLRCRDKEALSTLSEALNAAFPEGAKDKGLVLIHDNGSQFTSRRYQLFCQELGIKSVRTSYRHPETIGAIERFFGTVKEEEVWRKDYESYEEARSSILLYIQWYNAERIHSALGYKTPLEAYKDSLEGLAKREPILVSF